MSKKILECGGLKDKRFNPHYAKVKIFGKEDTIERHYVLCRRTKEGFIAGRIAAANHIEINGVKLDPKYLIAYYKLLWLLYFDKNPDIIEYAKGFDEFVDYSGNGKTSAIIEQCVERGTNSILTELLVKELMFILNLNKL